MDYFDDLEIIYAEYAPGSVSHCENHLFPYYGLQYIHAGEIRVSAGGTPENARGPVLFVTGPGYPFTYSTPNGKRDHFYVCFRGPRAEAFVRGGLLEVRRRDLLIPIRESAALLARLTNLAKAFHHPGPFGHAEAVIQLEKVLLHLARERLTQGRKTHRKMISALSDAVAADPGRAWDFDREAEKAGISPIQFRRIFHETASTPPWRYLLECRMNLASHLLLTSDLKIKEIADRCGFRSEFHFSRTFKKHTGYAPVEFRNMAGQHGRH